MFSTVKSVFIALVVLAFAWIALRGLEAKTWPMKIIAAAPLLLFLGWFSTGIIHLAQMRAALIDSADPNTTPDRLRALAEFRNGPGYEIDNRTAKNPNTPPDVLRLLHERPDQVGTEMCLAQNPNTPDDILIELANRDDDWSQYILNALKTNPRYEEVFSDRDSREPIGAESGRRE
jgi:hypothetical protein